MPIREHYLVQTTQIVELIIGASVASWSKKTAVILASHKRLMIQWKVTTVTGREEEARKFVGTVGGTKRNQCSI